MVFSRFSFCKNLFFNQLKKARNNHGKSPFATPKACINPIKMNATHKKRLIYTQDVYKPLLANCTL